MSIEEERAVKDELLGEKAEVSADPSSCRSPVLTNVIPKNVKTTVCVPK